MNRGDVVTADLSGGVGAEKDKVRPVAIAHLGDRTTLVLAVTDAKKKRLPMHVLLTAYSSGTQVKDALVTCEHAWSVDPSRLSPRDGARALTATELAAVGQGLRIALGLTPPRPTPGLPKHPRGMVVLVDFAGGVGVELTAPTPAVVLSNDSGNYFGQTLLVAPLVADALAPVPTAAGVVDLGRLRVVDKVRVLADSLGTLDRAELDRVGEALVERLPPTR